MENFKQELQKQTKLLIEEIKKVCNEIYEKAGTLDGFDIQISTLGEEVNIYEFKINDDMNTMYIISDCYDCNIECLYYEQLYEIYIQLKGCLEYL